MLNYQRVNPYSWLVDLLLIKDIVMDSIAT